MKCVNCKQEGEVLLHSLGKLFCKQCFAEVIEQRVRRLANTNKLFKQGINLRVKISNSNDKVLYHIINKKFKHIKIMKSLKPSMPQYTLDELCIKVLKSLLQSKPLPVLGISLLESTEESELKDYAKIEGINYKPVKRSGTDKSIHSMLLSIKEEHPNALFNIRKIYRKLGSQRGLK